VLLEDVLAATGHLVLPASRLAPNGLDAWARVLGSGYEGYVAKDQLGPYRGGVTRSWLKVKVPGWTDRRKDGDGPSWTPNPKPLTTVGR
jgi:ATP-dependent DNA ligase